MHYRTVYLERIREEVQRLEKIAQEARSKGVDPVLEVEMHPADDVAGRVEGLVGPRGVGARIRELTDQETAHNVAFEIAREIVQSAISDEWNPQVVADQAIRTALAILTEGITAGPLEGIAGIKIKSNSDGSRYLAVYFAGPIRAAGGTEAAQTVIVADAVRRILDLDRFKPSKEVIERYVEEVALYNRVSHLQYPSTPEEVRLAARNIPVEVTGEPTSEAEVTGYRDVPGIETNRLRGGAILVLNDSILGKAHKLPKHVEQMELPGWEWLKQLSPREDEETSVEKKIQPKDKYLEDIIAGRPVLAYPSRKGGFRIRYGRSRNTGLAALGVHPATMLLLDNFIACGTQLITERPGKGCIAMPVDSIHGPIVKLLDGSIRFIDSVADAKQYRDVIARILFLGDLLVGFGEFRENNHLLVPAGYCPEWWTQEVERTLLQFTATQLDPLYQWISPEELEDILRNPTSHRPDPWQALAISSALGVPLHPRYVYFWEDISVEQLQQLQEWFLTLEIKRDKNRVTALSGNRSSDIEEVLEILCIPCEVKHNQIWFSEAAPILYDMFIANGGTNFSEIATHTQDPLILLQRGWNKKLHPKGTFYVGARIGRPEKAKHREMDPPPNGLFPVGRDGGPTRDLIKAAKKKSITIESNVRQCSKCGKVCWTRICDDCESETVTVPWCSDCQRVSKSTVCEKCGNPTNTFGSFQIEIRKQLNRVRKQLGGKLPNRIKGVQGLISKHKTPEILEKAVLRARHDLYVYKDGTIRFDITDAPLSHFKPCEIGVSTDELHTLGYLTDIHGNHLHDENQILELKTQDIIIPHECANYLFRVSRFLDDLLTTVYNLQPYYNLDSPTDLVGHLVVGLAPHTSAGIIGRIIGFTTLRVCYAHPFWHAAKRRNCLSGTEEVLLWDTKEDQLLKLPLGQIIENLLENGTPSQIVDDFGTIAIDNPHTHWRTISLDPTTHQPIYQPIKHWIKGTSHHWLTITTHSGRTITMTPDHNAMTWNSTTNTIQRTKAHQLQVGDYIPLLSSIEVPTKNPPQTINILKELANNLPNTEKFQTFKHQTRLRNAAPWMRQKLHRFALPLYNQQHNTQQTTLTTWKCTHTLKAYFKPMIPKKRRTSLFSPEWYQSIPLTHLETLEREGVFQWNEIPNTAQLGMARDDHTITPYIPFNQNLVRLLGYYIAEGYIRDEPTCYQTNFSVPHPKLRTHLKSLIQTALGSTPYYKKDNHQLVHTGRIHAYLLAYAWKMGTNAYSKRLPGFIYSLSEDLRLDFLSAYIDGDGSIPATDKCILFYSVSQKLLGDVGLLLSTLGVFYRHRQDPSPGRYGPSVLARYEELDKIPKKQIVSRISVRGPDLLILERLTLMHPTRQKNAQRILDKGVPVDRVIKASDGMLHTLGGTSKTAFDIIADIQIINREMPAYCLRVIPEKTDDIYNNIHTSICIANCDGDEDSVLLALDPMVNFSREYLPTSRGGTMDAPLVLSVTVAPKEIDDEAHNIDGNGRYPLEFYERTLQFADPRDVEDIFDLVAHRIGSDAECYGLGYSMPTCDVNYGPRKTTYTRLKTMQEKVDHQLALAGRIAAVDVKDMARRLLDSHFLPDIFGNIRAFTSQKFRCTSCNAKFRRIPLTGKCSECSGKLVLTVTKAGITKYIDMATNIAKHYDLPLYYRQRLENASRVIDSLFPPEEADDQQATLKDFTPPKPKRSR